MKRLPMNDQQRDPEAFLAVAAQEGRGRLKIFLGAAPGVGKSWEMLAAGRAAMREGRKVLVGVVETHGRAETAAQIGDLPILPYKKMPYRGQMLEEFDVESAIAAHPDLLLVDEMAHTNAPMSRHHKRWEDVADVLDAGIDVWTTLNIQHIESLNDAVARITGIRVTETLPDKVLEIADEIELIDLPPAELRKRVSEGKVYRSDIARRALEGFFREGNLSSLRQMALQQTASIVDTKVRDYMRRKSIAGPWPSGHRVMALLRSDESAEQVVRHAKRLAAALQAPWIALHVEQGEESEGVRRALEIASQLGAEVEIRGGTNVAQVAVDFARERNVTHVVIGRVRGWLWNDLRQRRTTSRLVQLSGDFTLHVVPLPQGGGRKQAAPRRAVALGWQPWAVTLGMLGTVTAVGELFSPWLQQEGLGMLYLAAVVAAASLYGLVVALCTAVLGFVLWNMLFIPPLYTFTISNSRDVIAVLVFGTVATITGLLASRLRAEVQAAQQRIANMQLIQNFGRNLGQAATEGELLGKVASLAASLANQAVVLMPRMELLEIAASAPTTLDTLDEGSWAAAQWCFSRNEPTGMGTSTLPSSVWRFLPWGGADTPVGVIGVRTKQPLGQSHVQTLAVLADHAATSVQRVRLTAQAANVRAQGETQKLRTALLNSLSHDLRTPLAAIRGAAGALRQSWDQLAEATREDLLTSIEQDVVRMTRFLVNITEMTRLETGEVVPKITPVVLRGVVDAALDRVPDLDLPGVMLADDLPLCLCDPMLLEQALVNVLENAVKYGPSHGLVRIWAASDGKEITLHVADEGPGISPEDLPHIFDSFYRARREDRVVPGTGLGLAIARGLVEAMGGRIWARSPRPDAALDASPGTDIAIALPQAR
jgi:two-component system, OmpR family, sensor histidine kinase KdpD